MKTLLIDAHEEIQSLRRQNEILTAKVEVMDLFGLALRTVPMHGMRGMAPDVAWQLQKAIAELEAKPGDVRPGDITK